MSDLAPSSFVAAPAIAAVSRRSVASADRKALEDVVAGVSAALAAV